MARDRKVSTPKFRPTAGSGGEWVTDELPPAVLEYARKIRVDNGRSYREISDEALRQIGEAFSMYRQTSAPPPQLDVSKAGELREVIADLFARIDGIDDGLSLALDVAWHHLFVSARRYTGDAPYDGSELPWPLLFGPYQHHDKATGAWRAMWTKLFLLLGADPGFKRSPPQERPVNLDGWPAARNWLHCLDAGLEHLIDAAPRRTGGAPREEARDRLLAAVAQALMDDGVRIVKAREDAAGILDAAHIPVPDTARQLRAAAKRGGLKP